MTDITHRAEFTAYQAISTVIPWDDTVPQANEGTLLMSKTFVPQHSTVRVIAEVAASALETDQGYIATLVHDGQVVDVGVSFAMNTAPRLIPASIDYMGPVTPGVETTFQVRAGPRKVGTIYTNGHQASRLFGGISKSSLTITEFGGTETSLPGGGTCGDEPDLLNRFMPEEYWGDKKTVHEGWFYAGRVDASPYTPDLLWRNQRMPPTSEENHPLSFGHQKLHVSGGLVALQHGDCPDIVIGRGGPNGAPYNEPNPQATDPGLDVGHIQFVTLGGTLKGTLGWRVGDGHQGAIAQIGARSVGTQTATSRAGELYLATCPLGRPGDPLFRMMIKEDGSIHFLDTDGAPMFGAGPTYWDIATVKPPTTEGATSLWLAVKQGSNLTLKPVTVGAPDSGGSGKRALVVAN